MAASQVFRPSNGDLHIRTFMDHGQNDTTAPKNLSRPSTTAGGYRFGQLSHNSFFTRHNPHPSKVSHMKGLLDVPICVVNDDGFVANPRYSMTPSKSAPSALQFPPNNHNQRKMKNYQIPSNAININSQLHPINTITGLQYFTGLNSYPWRERALPIKPGMSGLVPVTETWQDELRRLTNQALTEGEEMKKQNENVQKQQEPKRRGTQYSATTGRLIPPPSRALSRGPSRGQRTMTMGTRHNEHIRGEDREQEAVVFEMLCRILQTEDYNAVQAWLCSAGEREKEMVINMIRGAISSQDDYGTHYVQPNYIDTPSRDGNVIAPVPENVQREEQENIDKIVDRLSLTDGTYSRQTIRGEGKSTVVPLPSIYENKNEEAPVKLESDGYLEYFIPDPNIEYSSQVVSYQGVRPPTTMAFRNGPERTPPRSAPQEIQAKFKFTKTPSKTQKMQEEHVNLLDNNTWNPNDSHCN